MRRSDYQHQQILDTLRNADDESQHTSKVSPFLPAYLNNIDSIRKKQDRDSSAGRTSAQDVKYSTIDRPSSIEQDLKHPNFLAAVFSFLENDEEYLANEQQTEIVHDVFNKFYGIQDEAELEKNNTFLNLINRAHENRQKANKQSLTTVSACSQVINSVLIGQHQPWVQKMHDKYLKQTKHVSNKETVFDRIHLDELYREQKKLFLERIDKMDYNYSNGKVKGFISLKAEADQALAKKKARRAKTTGKQYNDDQNSADQSDGGEEQTDGDGADCLMNRFDLESFLRGGGKIRDLVNPQKFATFLKIVQDEFKVTTKQLIRNENKHLLGMFSRFAFSLMLYHHTYME